MLCDSISPSLWVGNILAVVLCIAGIICAVAYQQNGGYPPLTHLLETARYLLLTMSHPLHLQFCSGNNTLDFSLNHWQMKTTIRDTLSKLKGIIFLCSLFSSLLLNVFTILILMLVDCVTCAIDVDILCTDMWLLASTKLSKIGPNEDQYIVNRN